MDQPKVSVLPPFSILFDTNAYRNLVAGKDLKSCEELVNLMNKKEKELGIVSYAHFYAMTELIAHLSDTADPHYNQCLNAICALIIHNAEFKNALEISGIRQLAEPEADICQSLFDITPAEHIHAHEVLVPLATYIYQNAPNIVEPIALEQIGIIREVVEDLENEWIASVKAAMAAVDPVAAASWSLYSEDKALQDKYRAFFASEEYIYNFAIQIVIKYARILELAMDAEQIKLKAIEYLDKFPAPNRIMQKILCKIATPMGYSLEHAKEKRGNYVWDYAFLHCIGPHSFLQGMTVLLVTGDKKIHEAAKDSKCSEKVITLQEYASILNL